MPELVIPDWPAPPCVHAFTTTRAGGVSTGSWGSLNLGDRCGDRPASVRANRRRVREMLPSDPVWLRQVHGTRVIGCDPDTDAGREADAAFTTHPGLVCAVLTADCLPVLLCDRDGGTVAAAHAGWKGLAAGVLEATIEALGVDAGSLLAWLGPGIGAGVYEVGVAVRDEFTRADAEAAALQTLYEAHYGPGAPGRVGRAEATPGERASH